MWERGERKQVLDGRRKEDKKWIWKRRERIGFVSASPNYIFSCCSKAKA
jgi:hypothetical protein